MSADRLLIIDDEPNVRDFIKDVADEMEFEIVDTGDFDTFWAAYRDLAPTVITVDLQMPEVDGVELLRHLADDKCAAAIVLISGLDPKVLQTARRLGETCGLNMLATLQKPIQLSDIESVFARAKGGNARVTMDDLKRAIDERELRLHFQPKIMLPPSRASNGLGFEALVRWQHPVRGLIPPGEFIPLAESNGLIGPLSCVVFEAALTQLGEWNRAGAPWNGHASVDSVGVNLSAKLLGDLGLPDRLAKLARSFDVPPEQIVVEVTESGVMEDAARAMEILTRLRVKGFGLSMDDFGTGYSSLVQLYRMPFSELKIDRSFVMDIGESREAEAIVGVTVELGHALNLSVCAEGVETREALEFLRSANCDKAQGYFIGRPVPADALPEMFDKIFDLTS